jgi:Tfp pilus assembly PilM family ATPase
LFSRLKLGRVKPPIRRVLALDAGSRSLKLLLAESDFGHLRILKEELIDLQAEGLVSADETKAHLQATLADLGRPPLALALPQHLSISQTVELAPAPEAEVKNLIHDEIVKLSGVSETRIVYDFVRIEAAANNRQQFWVTLCQDGDVRDRILRLGIEQEDLCEVTTTAGALVNAYRAMSPSSSRAILAHLGAQSTVLVILLGGQAAFVTSFQMGGDFLTRSLARVLACSEEKAESIKCERNVLKGEAACPEFALVLDGWVAELKRQLNDWFEHNPPLAAEVASFELIASGGGFDQPGLIGYLETEAGLSFHPWPKPSQPETVCPSKRFEVAFGTALQALGHSAQPISLLPEDYRANWQKRLTRQRIESASVVLVLACFLLLALGTWQTVTATLYREALLAKVQASRESVRGNDLLTAQLAAQYEELRPLLARQQFTLDALNTLALLQQSRSNRSFWHVLLADQQTYFRGPVLTFTNKPAGTNLPVKLLLAEFGAPPAPAALTNAPLGTRGFIAELCVPEDPETARGILSQLVNDLNQQPLFTRVDLLSDDQRRNLADPKVIVPDRHFALELDLAATEFEQPLPVKRPPGPRGPSPPSKTGAYR